MCRKSDIYDRIVRNCDHVFNPETGDYCWVWLGGTSGTSGRGAGYGRISINSKTCATHRVMATHVYGYIPSHMQVDHKCKNRLCCNPVHLEVVTHKTNQRRK